MTVSFPLEEAFAHTKKQFKVSAEHLKEVTDYFVEELHAGLSSNDPTKIPMIVSWVMDYPDGTEKGEYLAIDLGGTNLRVIRVTLLGDSKFTSIAEKFPIPSTMRKGTVDQLWKFIATAVDGFVKRQFKGPIVKNLPLGFTFSFAATQSAINKGVLQSWTKGYDIDGVEGHDVVPMLQDALDELKTPVEVTALINDTTGTLVASVYCNTKTIMGCIFGTGVNGAYYERVEDIGKLEGKIPYDIVNESPAMAINCEYGAFDSSARVLKRTKYDVQVDIESPRPGEQLYEKMIAGYYLGEVLRLVLLDYYEQGLLFPHENVEKLQVAFCMDTSFPSRIEEYGSSHAGLLFFDTFGITTTEEDRKLIHDLCVLIGLRAARLSATAIAAIMKKRGYTQGDIACDGSVYDKYPNFKKRVMEALNDIFEWNTEQYPVRLTHAEDGSGVGAAIIACLTEKRLAAGKSVGMISTKL
ncbi:hypothetical protein CANINC_005035 [Pichia inconspicua]|uniref:Phosphotransferase n=1 Tax=Pichia inconspicua TaxID=52247 RepID=A0A4T0WUF5_9ASCO|nr:hypothetical protein CANINC_005035 [[Candida] inconspicua]